ncbi:hypothetical protein V6N13_019838 [Hibiscus sabdariffa]
MLQACVIDFGKNWEKSLPLVEFAYNNSYQVLIQMATFEALCGRRCRNPLCWLELGETKVLGPQLLRDTEEKIRPYHTLEPEEVELNPDLSYEEEPVQILDREVKRLRNKSVPLVKVLWRNQKVEEATWELVATMKEQYPHLFNSDQERIEIQEEACKEPRGRRNKGIVIHNPSASFGVV